MEKNKVVAGDYKGSKVSAALGETVQVWTAGLFKKPLYVDKQTVEKYELVTDEHRKSAASGVSRGLVGGMLLGPVGLMAGALTAKSKGTYTVAIHFKDGKQSLLVVDEKIYKNIVKQCF